jgi:hypothetical protein
MRTQYGAPHCAASSILLPLHPYQVQIFYLNYMTKLIVPVFQFTPTKHYIINKSNTAHQCIIYFITIFMVTRFNISLLFANTTKGMVYYNVG